MNSTSRPGKRRRAKPYAVIEAVSIWPIGFDPVLALEATHDKELAADQGLTHTGKLRKPEVAATLKRYAQGDTTPKGGWHCRTCRLRDVSRVA